MHFFFCVSVCVCVTCRSCGVPRFWVLFWANPSVLQGQKTGWRFQHVSSICVKFVWFTNPMILHPVITGNTTKGTNWTSENPVLEHIEYNTRIILPWVFLNPNLASLALFPALPHCLSASSLSLLLALQLFCLLLELSCFFLFVLPYWRREQHEDQGQDQNSKSNHTIRIAIVPAAASCKDYASGRFYLILPQTWGTRH